MDWHAELERAARQKTAELLQDDHASQNDPRFAELKRRIADHGTIKEQCEVFVHEFARHPDRSYHLGLGDVTFFELTPR